MSSSNTKRVAAIDGGAIGAAFARTLTGVMPDSALVQAALNVRNLP